ncbi:hypothetical protein B0H13DRAFT_1913949 [Mycena leptocephala]|nr:hypothetical protein B0H13DRAFT_1913949 [Mycena leptocephala]
MVPEGEFADLGRIFEDDTEPFVYNGFAKNITVLYTPPAVSSSLSSVKLSSALIESGPEIAGSDGFCGLFPRFWIQGVLASSILGNIQADGLSSSGKAHSQMRLSILIRGAASAINITPVELVRTWEVVEAS